MIAREWRMANGEWIKIEDMDDNHLDNSIKMLERNDFCLLTPVGACYPEELYYDAEDSLDGEGHIIHALMCIEKQHRENIKLAKSEGN